MSADLIEQVKDGVAVLTLNRPDRLNAMSRPMLDALLEALRGSPKMRRSGWSCSPGPAAASARAATSRPWPRAPSWAPDHGGEGAGAPLAHGDLALAARDAKPTIAMMRGPAAGAGLSLAMACDMRIASDTVKLGTAFARVGTPATSAAATT